jgi:predicted ATPase
MAQLEGITIRNYRALSDVTLGRTFENRDANPLPRMLAIIGPNGCGKSTLMDALGFLGDCLRYGADEACDHPHRGGFERLRTRGKTGPIIFEVYYREEANARPISYTLHIELDAKDRPRVSYERLRQRRKGQRLGQPYSFLEVMDGSGFAWAGEETHGEEGTQKVAVNLEDRTKLGITTLGNLSDHPRIVGFRQFLEGWYLSYFVPDLARALPVVGAQKHLNRRGDNLANYLMHIERQEPRRFAQVLNAVAAKIPGVERITHTKSADNRLLIQFNERGYQDPFFQQDMSDGTLKMLAYLLLFEDPESAPLVGIEEPENGLHHQLLQPLAQQMKQLSSRGGPQLFVTTHSPNFVDALTPEQVWILAKEHDGFSMATRAADAPTVKELFAEGIPLGSLWFSNHFGRGNP